MAPKHLNDMCLSREGKSEKWQVCEVQGVCEPGLQPVADRTKETIFRLFPILITLVSKGRKKLEGILFWLPDCVCLLSNQDHFIKKVRSQTGPLWGTLGRNSERKRTRYRSLLRSGTTSSFQAPGPKRIRQSSSYMRS